MLVNKFVLSILVAAIIIIFSTIVHTWALCTQNQLTKAAKRSPKVISETEETSTQEDGNKGRLFARVRNIFFIFSVPLFVLFRVLSCWVFGFFL